MTTPHRIVVAGGAGAVGAMFARALHTDGHTVTILDPAAAPAPAPPGGPRVVHGDVTAPTGPAEQALRTAHTVLLAVPEPVALRAVPVLDALLHPDALLVDTLSVKTVIGRAFATALPGRAALGLNPMFAPSLPMRGRPVAAVTYRPGPAVDEFLAALRRWGAQPVPLTADDHDRITAATQALTHAVILAFGVALDRLDPPAAADVSAPPPHRLLRALLARIGSGTAEVYHDVQAANPHAAAARRALRDGLDIVDAVCGADDLDGFTALQRQARGALGADVDGYRRLCAGIFGMLPPTGPDTSNGSGDDRA